MLGHRDQDVVAVRVGVAAVIGGRRHVQREVRIVGRGRRDRQAGEHASGEHGLREGDAAAGVRQRVAVGVAQRRVGRNPGDGDGNDPVRIDLAERGGDVERDMRVLVAGGGAAVLIAGSKVVEVEVRRRGGVRGDGDADGAAGGGGRAAVGGGGLHVQGEGLHLAVATQRQRSEIGWGDGPGGGAARSGDGGAVIEAGAGGHAGDFDGNDRVGIDLG